MNVRTKTSKQATKAPVAKLQVQLLQAAVWEQQVNDGTAYSVSFERRYRDAEGNWHSTHSYNANDLLALAKLADLAHTEIARLRAANR